MDPRHLELAAEFCKIAGKQNLVEYLGLKPGCSPDEAQEELRRKRKYMQGMQSNPKYRNEALNLIKNFGVYSQLLQDPAKYAAAARKRAESAHLPVVEMTIKGALRGGPLSPEQVDYLKRNASELGVGDETFTGTLDRLMRESGLPPLRTPGPEPLAVDSLDEVDPTDHYHTLGVARTATRAEIHAAYEQKLQLAKALRGPEGQRMVRRVETAWALLGDLTSREIYDLSRRNTGPPARDRDASDAAIPPQSPLHGPTAPPVRRRTHTPRRQGDSTPQSAPAANRPTQIFQLEVAGDAVRQVKVGQSRVNSLVHVHLEGDRTAAARVSSDQPWLIAEPTRLEPGLLHYVVTVHIDPKGMRGASDTGTVTIQTERGDRATVTFEVERTNSFVSTAVAAGVLALVLVVAFVTAWIVLSSVLATPAAFLLPMVLP